MRASSRLRKSGDQTASRSQRNAQLMIFSPEHVMHRLPIHLQDIQTDSITYLPHTSFRVQRRHD